MRLLIVTDAWHPQINGVVRTLERLGDEVRRMGTEVSYLTPLGFRSVAMPSSPEIRLAVTAPGAVAREIAARAPDHVHIATEGPLGLAARRACLAAGRIFTTSYHTRFPEYLRARLPVPERWSYAWLRRFHNAGAATLVATPSLAGELTGRGFTNVRLWTRGVDAQLFRPRRTRVLDLPRPLFLSVGRVAVEKNLEAFLALDLPGTKVVVGDGPARAMLQARYPDAVFLGTKVGQELAAIYASCDVFVFPSRTDTFGIVLLEALASGLPVAAYPVTGPLDVIGGTGAGVLHDNLGIAARQALSLSPGVARQTALRHSWEACARLFLEHVDATHDDVRGAAA